MQIQQTSTENLLLIVCGSIPTLKPLYDLRHEHFSLPLSYFSTGKFSSGTSSKAYSSDNAQKRSRRLYLDPYSASRIDSQDHSLGVTSKARGPDAKDHDGRSGQDDPSAFEMGHINVERRWEVDTER